MRDFLGEKGVSGQGELGRVDVQKKLSVILRIGVEMKNYTTGRIYCNCSTRMHCRGKAVKIYENTSEKQKCPNCKKLRRAMVKK